MEVKIGIGLDDIVFGMSQEEVKSILGLPDKVYEFEEIKAIVYCYNKFLIKIYFDRREYLKLYTIEVSNPEAVMFGQKIIGKEKKEVLDILSANGHTQFEHDDQDFLEFFLCESIWSSFSFEFDRLTNFYFSPLCDEHENTIWPERK